MGIAVMSLLRAFIQRRVAELGSEVSVYIRYLDSGRVVGVNQNARMETMSVIKVVVFLELMLLGERDPAILEREVTVGDDLRRLGTGVLSKLASPRLSLENAARLMIVESDNTATDMCIRAVGGPGEVNERSAARGFGSLQLGGWAGDWFRALAVRMDLSGEYAGLTDGAIARRGYPIVDSLALLEARRAFSDLRGRHFGFGTTEEFGRLLALVWGGTYGSKGACRKLLAVMRDVSAKGRIARDLIGCQVYNKSGSFDPHVVNDIGIVVPPVGEPFVMAMFINGFNGRLVAAESAIAEVAERCAWDCS